MIVLGLTGSIAMGKSTAAAMFRRMGVPVSDADHIVHDLFAPGGRAVALIEKAFPGCVKQGRVDRQALGQRVFADPAALQQIETLVHPLVRQERDRFLQIARRRRHSLVVLDIPLLYETGAERSCHSVVVVSAPATIQQARLRQRPGMTSERIEAVLRRQLADKEKRKRADFIISSGLGRAHTYRTIATLVQSLKNRNAPLQRLPKRSRYRGLDCSTYNM